ncbi:VWA domain-containing protein [Pseudenhygromyxa sp. WMMC2535]|nr:VWA domain-containing protein [Pseudenhygromyxa sp. WMMC2535]
MTWTLGALLAAAAPLTFAGCSAAYDESALGGDESGSSLGSGVGQGGAQDFGLFREILLEGGIPGPDTIDDMGFFAEHKIDLPAADCGQDVCIHGMLGVMGNMINGSNCTLVLVGMNTPIDPAVLERPPLNLTIAVDLSQSMDGEPIARVREGLLRMRDSLEADDRITLVGFGDNAEVLIEQAPGDSAELAAAIASLIPSGSTNIYAGLRTAFEEVDAFAQEGWQNRVILVSDGVATAGITNSDKIEGLASAWSEAGYGLTTIGIGNDFDVDLMRTLSELGSGSFYYIEDPQAVEEVFEEEVQAFTVPLAEEVTIDATVFEGYDLRSVYGTKQAETWGNEAHIDIPILQLAHRVSDDDNENGRRGGGGAMVFELLPTGEDPGEVGRLEFAYQVPGTEDIVEQSVDITSPLAAWETPEDGFFTDASVEKGFVMLNIYVGFRMAATRAAGGDYAGALTVLEPLVDSVEGWLAQNPDADIEDDLFYIRLFIQNIEEAGGAINTPNPVPPDPWPED